MDFRNLDRMGDSDEAILEEPYRPFYDIFGHKPVLVKQYSSPWIQVIEQMSNAVIDTMTTRDLGSEIGRCLERYYSITSRRMLEITPRMRGVRLHSTFDRKIYC